MTNSPLLTDQEAEVFNAHSIARAEQGYCGKAPTCRDCARLQHDVIYTRGTRPWNRYESFPSETNPRCGIGGFAVLLTGICSKYEPK